MFRPCIWWWPYTIETYSAKEVNKIVRGLAWSAFDTLPLNETEIRLLLKLGECVLCLPVIAEIRPALNLAWPLISQSRTSSAKQFTVVSVARCLSAYSRIRNSLQEMHAAFVAGSLTSIAGWPHCVISWTEFLKQLSVDVCGLVCSSGCFSYRLQLPVSSSGIQRSCSFILTDVLEEPAASVFTLLLWRWKLNVSPKRFWPSNRRWNRLSPSVSDVYSGYILNECRLSWQRGFRGFPQPFHANSGIEP